MSAAAFWGGGVLPGGSGLVMPLEVRKAVPDCRFERVARSAESVRRRADREISVRDVFIGSVSGCCPASVPDGPICRENSFCGGKAAAFPYSFPRGRSENSKKIEIFLCLPSGSLCPVLGRSFQEGYRGGFRDRAGAATDPSFFRPEENSRIGLPQRIAFRFSGIVRIDPGNYVLLINMLVFSVVF